MTAREATRKLVVDFPASVMEQLEARKSETGETIKQQVLHALQQAYGIKPAGQ